MSAVDELIGAIAQLPLVKSAVPAEIAKNLISKHTVGEQSYPVYIWIGEQNKSDIHVLKTEYNVHVMYDTTLGVWIALLGMDEVPADSELKTALNSVRQTSTTAFLTAVRDGLKEKAAITLWNFKDKFSYGYISLLRKLHEVGVECGYDLNIVDYQSTYCGSNGLQLTKVR